MAEELVELRATLGEYQDFMRSNLWLDMRNEIQRWLSEIRDKLESEDDVMEIHRLQGASVACRNFLSHPDVVISALMVNSR